MNFSPRRSPAIVHEAESQRQFTRYRIPLEVIHDGKVYRVADWSVGGFGLSGVSLDLSKGSVHQFTLIFPFDSYRLSLTVEAEIKHNDSAKRRLGVAFVNLTGPQNNVIRHVLNSFLAGEIVDAGDVFEVTARSMTTQSRSLPPAPKAVTLREKVSVFIPRLVAWTVIAAIAVGVLAFLSASLYDKFYVVQSSSATIAGNSYVLSSPMDGLVGELKPGAALKPSDKVFTVLARPGESVTVSSVCTCTIREVYAANGTYVREGDRVVSVLEPNSRQYIDALVERRELGRLYGNVRVKAKLIDGTVLPNAKIRKFPALLGREGSVELMTVEIDPGVALPAEMIGRPALVNFDLAQDSFVGRLQEFVEKLREFVGKR